jgi:hypothetical protein
VLSSRLTIVRNAASRSAAVAVEVTKGGSAGAGCLDVAGEDVVVVTEARLDYLLRTIKPFCEPKR